MDRALGSRKIAKMSSSYPAKKRSVKPANIKAKKWAKKNEASGSIAKTLNLPKPDKDLDKRAM